jgi:cation diffusion facilitator CzcD-associated flavoprotein CzcO
MGTHYQIAIIGAGFSGLGAAIRLLQHGFNDLIIFERATEVGGTWRDNTYPGCACDVQSHLYSFSFAPNPNWSEAYSRQPEILDYIKRIVTQYNLQPLIRFQHNVIQANWDAQARCWRIETSGGAYTATYIISGHGPLAEPKIPDIPGLKEFTGTLFHSARWNHEHDLRGERVAVIGTGASAVQFVPAIQPLVANMHIFQRTPPWVVPRLNRPFSAAERLRFQRLPWLQQLERLKIYLQRELTVLGFFMPSMEQLFTNAAQTHLAAQVADPELRRKLTPNYHIGCKRITVSDDFYPALTQPNVELIAESVVAVQGNTVIGSAGSRRQVDTIILGTGFYTAQTPAAKIFRGRDGRSLWEIWGGTPQAYLGMTVSNFPNLFLMVGPNTGLGHSSIIYMIESQIAYIVDCLMYAKRHHLTELEVRPEHQRNYNETIQRELSTFIWSTGECTSFYQDAHGRNIGLWPGFTFRYRQRTRHFHPAAYRLAR